MDKEANREKLFCINKKKIHSINSCKIDSTFTFTYFIHITFLATQK